jgi:hypothetical protein
VWLGSADEARHGKVWWGQVWLTRSGKVRCGGVWLGKVRLGLVWYESIIRQAQPTKLCLPLFLSNGIK